MEGTLILINITVILVLFACLGMTLIGLPGNVVLFLTVLGYAIYDNFVHVTWQSLGVIVGAIILGELVETFMGAIWAKREKASKLAIGVAVLGTIIGGIAGTALFPGFGSIIGAFLGGFISSVIAEYRMTKDKDQAWRVGISVFKGQLLGVVIKFSIAVASIVYLLSHMAWG